MDDSKHIRIFIIDDHPMVIEGLRNMLQNAAGIELAGYATTAAASLAYFRDHSADVVLMDINLPDGNGVDLCDAIRQKRPDVKILGLSTMNHPSTVRSMKEKGASGYLLKSSSDTEIIRAIVDANAGRESWDASVVMEHEKKDTGLLLTRRERDVLTLTAAGVTEADIADRLSMNLSTVRLHQKSLMSKLKVDQIGELADAVKKIIEL